MTALSNLLGHWMLVVCMFYCTDGLLLHSDDDLIAAYQDLVLQVQAMKSEMVSISSNATSLSTKTTAMAKEMTLMSTNATSMAAKITSMETKMTSMETDSTSKTNQMTSKIASLESAIHKLQTAQGSLSVGANYVRWGRTTCPSNGTTLVYEGYAAGSRYSETGGAANYLCLPADPQWDYYEDSVRSGGQIYGAEYQSGEFHSTGGSKFLGDVYEEDVPCAVCSTQRSEVLMIPAKRECHPGWTKEYSGYLMSGDHTHPSATEFVCVDKHVEVVAGGHVNQKGRLFYFVEGICGSLKCPPYINGRELTCVVCSK